MPAVQVVLDLMLEVLLNVVIEMGQTRSCFMFGFPFRRPQNAGNGSRKRIPVSGFNLKLLAAF